MRYASTSLVALAVLLYSAPVRAARPPWWYGWRHGRGQPREHGLRQPRKHEQQQQRHSSRPAKDRHYFEKEQRNLWQAADVNRDAGATGLHGIQEPGPVCGSGPCQQESEYPVRLSASRDDRPDSTFVLPYRYGCERQVSDEPWEGDSDAKPECEFQTGGEEGPKAG